MKQETMKQSEAKLAQSSHQNGIGAHIEVFNSHVMHELHPCGMLLAEFKNAFLFGNRHLLFIECRNPSQESTPLLSSVPEAT